MDASKVGKITLRTGSNQGKCYELSQALAILGRLASVDVYIDHASVSRKHASITQEGDRYAITDLGSSNGTFVNGQRLSGPVTLASGDVIRLGAEIELLFEQPEELTAGAAPATVLDEKPTTVDLPSPPKYRLEVACPGSGLRSYDLTQEVLTIGRALDNDIIVEFITVSRHHARLERGAAGYSLVLLPSASNPIVIGGARLADRMPLNDGAEFHIEGAGGMVVFRYHAPVSAAPAPIRSGLAQGTPIRPVPAPAAPVIPAAPRQQPGTYRAETPPQQPPSQPRVVPPERASGTVLESGVGYDVSGKPPELIVSIAGESTAVHTIVRNTVKIGRAPENDVVIPSMIVSRHQATIERAGDGYVVSAVPEATNPILCQGRPVLDRQRLNHGDTLRIGSDQPGMMVTLVFLWPAQAALGAQVRTIDLGEKERLTIGRDPGNDVVLAQPVISRYHAQVTRVGRRYYVSDLQSANGTFVNDRRIETNTWLQPNDTIRIGPYRFVLGENQFVRYDETNGLRVEAMGLNKWVRKKLNLLQDISLIFQPREFIVVVGQSGGGKSTLIDSIAGYRPATHGKVFVNGIDVYRSFDAIRNEIGYVPQRDIIHMELTVYQALDYAAKLRMPRDTSKEERHKRILEVLEDLDLTHRKDVQISGLSGGQQKRVSIGVELLTRPGLFFLDEPTSGLDPGTETAFMHLMRRLADQGRTIIMVTHATKNVMLADKVVFLARGGYLAWFGPPDEALAYFDQFRTERERRTTPMEFDQIYAILDDASRGSAQEWAKRFQSTLACHKYIAQPLQTIAGQRQLADTGKGGRGKSARQPKRSKGISSLNQFFVLSARNFKILTRDRSSLTLMLVVPLAVGLLDFAIAPMMNNNPYDMMVGNPKNGSITLFLLTLYCLLVAGMSQMREFTKEADIYKRERLVNLRILPYITSKVWVAVILAFYQAAAYTVVHYLAFRMPGGTPEFGMVYVTLLLSVLAGMMGGLLASALSPNSSSAPLIMILLIIPQIVLSGVLAPVPTNVSWIASIRWGFQTLIGITGMGSDVSADVCWQLDKPLRDAMTLDDKAAQGCKCMGTAVFDKNSCQFPGVGEYYRAEVSQSAPVKPAELGSQPPDPVIPEAPQPPEDKYDQVKMAQYLNALSDYQSQVQVIQDNYKSSMQIYQAQAEVYKNQMVDYQKDLAEFEIARNSAVKGAEGLIDNMRDQFGWAWVVKSDPAVFYPWLVECWLAQVGLCGAYFLIILVLIKRKDAK